MHCLQFSCSLCAIDQTGFAGCAMLLPCGKHCYILFSHNCRQACSSVDPYTISYKSTVHAVPLRIYNHIIIVVIMRNGFMRREYYGQTEAIWRMQNDWLYKRKCNNTIKKATGADKAKRLESMQDYKEKSCVVFWTNLHHKQKMEFKAQHHQRCATTHSASDSIYDF